METQQGDKEAKIREYLDVDLHSEQPLFINGENYTGDELIILTCGSGRSVEQLCELTAEQAFQMGVVRYLESSISKRYISQDVAKLFDEFDIPYKPKKLVKRIESVFKRFFNSFEEETEF